MSVQTLQPEAAVRRGPKINFITQFAVIYEFMSDSWGTMQRYAQEYGDVTYLGKQDSEVGDYMIHHPDHIRETLIEQADKFIKDMGYTDPQRGLAYFLGNGLLTNNGEAWRKQRKLIQPAFHVQRISGYADVMSDYTQDMLTTWRDGQSMDIYDAMMTLTLRIVGKTLFGTDTTADTQRIAHSMEVLQDMSKVAFDVLPSWVPTPARIERQRAVQDLDRIIYRLIAERRAQAEPSNDLLSMLLSASDDESSAMSDKQVRDEAATLMLAGHETTSNALAWTFYLLSQNPHIVAKLQAELDQVLGGRTPRMADLKQLPYTEMVLKESMRLYPPAPAFSRAIMEDATMGPYTLKKGGSINVMASVTHRDPRWWDVPNEFRPERFAPENEKNIRKYAYLPFGVGNRICVGNMFAMMEAQLLLAGIAQHYTLDLAPNQTVVPVARITLSPRGGLRMIARQRTNIGTAHSAMPELAAH
jgi:cytochrome P450